MVVCKLNITFFATTSTTKLIHVTPKQSFLVVSELMDNINQLTLAACFQLLSEGLGTRQMTDIVPRNLDEQSEIQVINKF
jgi:hypothetical protein